MSWVPCICAMWGTKGPEGDARHHGAPGTSTAVSLSVSFQVVSPTISSPVCQEQLIEAGKLVDRSVENCVCACQAATGDSELLKQVSAAASVVSQALHDLLQHVRQFASRGEPIGRYDQATDTIMCVTESIFSSMGDAGEALAWERRGWMVWVFLMVTVTF